MEDKRPKVGVAVIIKRNNKMLLGKRKGSHGSGTWCFPGGHLEFFESFENCCMRETEEETGLKIDNIKFLTITSDFFKEENKHYITIFMTANCEDGESEIKEPAKFEEWRWFDFEELPKHLFLPIENWIKQNPSLIK